MFSNYFSQTFFESSTWCISDLLLTYYHFKMDRAFTISIFQINCKLICLKITQWRRRDPSPPIQCSFHKVKVFPLRKTPSIKETLAHFRKKDIFQYHIVQPNSKKLILFFLVAICIPSSINESLSSIQQSFNVEFSIITLFLTINDFVYYSFRFIGKVQR